MFGLFASPAKEAAKLDAEFLSHLTKIQAMGKEESESMLIAIGMLLHGVQNEGLGDPETVRGPAAKKLAKHLRLAATEFGPKTSIGFNLVAASVEAADIDHPLAHRMRQAAATLFLEAKWAYLRSKAPPTGSA